jgi:LacI family transcriptional regulator
MAEGTRIRILQEAERMGYDRHSNGAARALVARRYGHKSKTGNVAILHGSTGFSGVLRSHPFFTSHFEGAESEAERLRQDVFIFSLRASGLPRLIQEGGVDGVVCIAAHSAVADIKKLGLPVVALDFYSRDTISLIPDDREGMRLATRHLIELGHRRIAYLGFPLVDGAEAARERLRGYRQGLEDYGIAFDESLVAYPLPYLEMDVAAEAVKTLLINRAKSQAPLTALVCYNDVFAMGAVQAIQAAGLRVPHDLSVVGFDDVAPQYHFRPALTSVAFDRHEMGRQAVRLLSDWPETKTSDEKTNRQIFPVKLVVRDSTQAYIPSSNE